MKTQKIIKIISSLSGQYSGHQIFTDWCTMMAISISNSCELFDTKERREREDLYQSTASKYGADNLSKFAEMMAYLTESLEENPRDVLGEVYMKGGFGSKITGQFFTPYHLSELCARLCYEDPERAKDGKIHVNEPSCGGGGMIIAYAMELKEKGIDYQREMEVIAQDLDWNCVYMCYVQLSLLGIKALVVQGDALAEPFTKNTPNRRILVTPAKKGLFL